MLTRSSAFATLLVAVTIGAISAPRAEAQAPLSLTSLKLPLPPGSAWRVIQGYNGGTHVPGPEQYALDLVRDGGATGGVDVLAPASGSVWFAHAPGAGNGCISIKVDGGGGLIVQMCHIVLSRAMRPDERVTAGTPLGAIGADGRVGNNGIAHLHLSMHRTNDYGVTRIPTPFSSGNGLPLEGFNLPADGSRNQYACPGASCAGKLVSTMGLPTSSAISAPAASGAGAPPVAAPMTVAPMTVAPVPRPAAPAPPPAARIGLRAVVAGAGDCVNVREQPTTSGAIKACLPDGARLKIVEGPVAADGYTWWRLDGLGWAVGIYLSPVAPSLESGGSARVSTGQGECLNVRTAPAIASTATHCLADGGVVQLEAGPYEADGLTWWRLAGSGWVSGEYLTPEQ